jgi:hypothetical protein
MLQNYNVVGILIGSILVCKKEPNFVKLAVLTGPSLLARLNGETGIKFPAQTEMIESNLDE